MSVAVPLPQALAGPRILMTLDAVGGVWRYAMDLATGLKLRGFDLVFAGMGPQPTLAQRTEAEAVGTLIWTEGQLDWLASGEDELSGVSALLARLVDEHAIDLVHLNLPSQAAGLQLDVPVLVVSHSCVVTWFAAVRGSSVPADWQWQYRLNREGFDAADAVLAPSRSHADMLIRSYGPISGLDVVYNSTREGNAPTRKEAVVFAAGRWWDDGKNGALLDAAASQAVWPVAMAGPQNGPNGQYLALRSVQALGSLPHAQVEEWMSRAAVVASPSCYEPFGLAPLEAAKAGAALVLSDIPTYRELWNDAALFAPADDATGFAAAMNRLAGDDALRHDFAARARQRAALYTLERQVASMAQIYARLLPAQAARGL